MASQRYNVTFTSRQTAALENMAEELGTTKADVLVKALSLLQVAIREKREGNSLGIIRGTQVVKEIVGIWEQ